MTQNTNRNVSPYFDDFNESKNYNKVLFKPGFPVQARELTTLQSILQNQVERFGQHFFKEGSIVIPGSTFYDGDYLFSVLGTRQRFSRIAHYLGLWEGQVLLGASFQKQKVVVARQALAPPLACQQPR